jgi:diketogulonate reductase-like aldo/keto reductase
MYENEETLGAAIAGSGRPREAFFVTTKLSALPEGQTPKDALLKSLKHLRTGV